MNDAPQQPTAQRVVVIGDIWRSIKRREAALAALREGRGE